MQVILQPCGIDAYANFEKTIKNSEIKVKDIRKYLNDTQYNELQKIYNEGNCLIWGVLKRVGNVWNKIEKNDISFFYKKGELFFSGIVAYKMHNERLANHLWGKDISNGTWEYIYFVKQPKEIHIDFLSFRNIIGYHTNKVQKFTRLDEFKSNLVIEALSLDDLSEKKSDIDEVISGIIDEENNAFDKFKNESSIEKVITISVRKEQDQLRKYLFKGKLTMKCSICGKTLPIEFLWCSHIKKRSFCSKDEKLDYKNIVTPMCKFGCDDLYERGFIAVNQDGKIEVLKHTKNDFIDTYLSELEGKECLDFKISNKDYYQAHKLLFTRNSIKQ